MPAGDGTGPMGMGPLTGRAAGFCAGFGTPGYMNPSLGRGMGFGRGRGFWGRGGGRGFFGGASAYQAVPPTAAQQLDALKGQAAHFEGVLNELRKQITELSSDK